MPYWDQADGHVQIFGQRDPPNNWGLLFSDNLGVNTSRRFEIIPVWFVYVWQTNRIPTSPCVRSEDLFVQRRAKHWQTNPWGYPLPTSPRSAHSRGKGIPRSNPDPTNTPCTSRLTSHITYMHAVSHGVPHGTSYHMGHLMGHPMRSPIENSSDINHTKTVGMVPT